MTGGDDLTRFAIVGPRLQRQLRRAGRLRSHRQTTPRTALPICILRNILLKEWQVEVTDEWRAWWTRLADPVQDEVAAVVQLLEAVGPNLPFPYSSSVRGSAVTHLRELRIQAGGRAIRSLYAFDPRRVAVLLIGGDKTGDDRWYKRHVPRAERLYALHLQRLRQEGLIP